MEELEAWKETVRMDAIRLASHAHGWMSESQNGNNG